MHLHTMFGDRAGLIVNLMEDMDWYIENSSRSMGVMPHEGEVIIRTGVTYGETVAKMKEWAGEGALS